MYQIILEKSVTKFLDMCDHHVAQRFFDKAKMLSANPYDHHVDAKQLKGEDNIWRMRIGKYRFIYKIYADKLVILFVDADSRGDIYK